MTGIDFSALDCELKKGAAELLLLSVLEARPRHGYELGKLIETQSGAHLVFHLDSLYPLLYRLEERGWIKGTWVEKAGERRRRFYRLTPAGLRVLLQQRRTRDEFVGAVRLSRSLRRSQVMRRSTTVTAVLMVAVEVAGAAQTPAPPKVHLQLRSEAKASDEVLAEARHEVARIFARSGFEVVWTDMAPQIRVTIAARVLGYARAGSQVMGVAMRTTNGPVAQVFFQQVQDFARIYHIDLSTMLGHVIAHEVGHLLLPTYSHSPTGLMRGEWDHTQVHDAVRGALTFTDGQAQKMAASALVASDLPARRATRTDRLMALRTE